MKTNEDASNTPRGYDFLVGSSRTLSSRLGWEVIVFRAISFAWLSIPVLGLASPPLRAVSVAIVSLFTALLWKLVVLVSDRSQQRLERALIRFALTEDNGELEKVYVEWRHSDWLDSRLWRVLSIEPFLWCALTLGVLFLRLFVRV